MIRSCLDRNHIRSVNIFTWLESKFFFLKKVELKLCQWDVDKDKAKLCVLNYWWRLSGCKNNGRAIIFGAAVVS